MAASLCGVGLWLGASQAGAQPPAGPAAQPVTQVYYSSQPLPAVILAPEGKSPGAPMPAAANLAVRNQTPAPAASAAARAAETRAQPPLLRRTRFQGDMRGGLEDVSEYQIQLEPPGIERVTRRESERNLQERMKQEARQRPNVERIEFPPEPPLSTETYKGREFPPLTEVVEPHYVCYERLFFEDKNSERYGWDLGFVQPVLSAGIFFWDVAWLPYKLGVDPGRKFECSAGYCLPGDPVPYLVYPPRLSLTGTIFEAGTIVAGFGIFPG